jgi:hypothetical protein
MSRPTAFQIDSSCPSSEVAPISGFQMAPEPAFFPRPEHEELNDDADRAHLTTRSTRAGSARTERLCS